MLRKTKDLWYRSANKNCKSFIHMSSTAPIAEYLEGHTGKQGVASSRKRPILAHFYF